MQSTQREDKVVQPIQSDRRHQLVPGGPRQTATELVRGRKQEDASRIPPPFSSPTGLGASREF